MALGLGKQLNPKPLSCILLSWVKKGQFEEGTLCKHNPPQWRSWLLLRTQKKTLVHMVCGFEYNKGVLVSSLGLRPLKSHLA